MIRHAPRHGKVSDVRSPTQEDKIGGGEGPYETSEDNTLDSIARSNSGQVPFFLTRSHVRIYECSCRNI